VVQRGAHEGVEVFGAGVALARGFPHDLWFRLVFLEAHHAAAPPESRDKQEVIDLPRHGHADSEAGRARDGPMNLAGGGVERVDGFAMPIDDFFAAVIVDEGRRAVPSLATGECAPSFGAGAVIEGDRGGALAANEAEKQIVPDERMSSEAPGG